MKHFYPAYYKAFRCIATACPDSCCQGWDVVIDEETEGFYNSVPGDFGKKLRSAIYTDPDGDRVFRLVKEKKCPFWGEDKLCDIYKTLGEDHLCLTCAQFPRITMDYTVFCEHTLALACPEAARLILSTDLAYTGFDEIECTDCEEYDTDVMRFLLATRRQMADVLTSPLSLAQQFEKLLRTAEEAQKALTGNFFKNNSDLTKIYEQLEYIDEENRVKIAQAADKKPNFSQYKKELSRLALYFLYRYLLSAIDTLDVLSPIRFLVHTVGIIANLAEKNSDIITAAQLCSKEIEQSYENMDALWEAFDSQDT